MQRQDYVLKLIEQLGVFFRQIVRYRELGQTDQALLSIVRAQETLFGKPAGEFSALSVEQQFRVLTEGEPPSRACDKAGAYAALLRSASEIYTQRGQDALADGASMLSAAMIELMAEANPDAARATMDRMARLQAGDNA